MNVETREGRRAALIDALRMISPDKPQHLEDLKAMGIALRRRADIVWHLLLQGFATMGNSRGWKGLFGDPLLLAAVSYEHLDSLDPSDRTPHIEAVFRKAKVRMPQKKAAWLVSDFDMINGRGGPAAVWQVAQSLQSREEKISFMKAFDGVGEKYARNAWMDLYDDAFHDSVAVDQRIKTMTEALGYSFSKYSDHEDFYRGIAVEAGLSAWEVDRPLYWFLADFLGPIRFASADASGSETAAKISAVQRLLNAFDELSPSDQRTLLDELGERARTTHGDQESI